MHLVPQRKGAPHCRAALGRCRGGVEDGQGAILGLVGRQRLGRCSGIRSASGGRAAQRAGHCRSAAPTEDVARRTSLKRCMQAGPRVGVETRRVGGRSAARLGPRQATREHGADRTLSSSPLSSPPSCTWVRGLCVHCCRRTQARERHAPSVRPDRVSAAMLRPVQPAGIRRIKGGGGGGHSSTRTPLPPCASPFSHSLPSWQR